ncbi:hypothetical protein [Candidatus Magnetominusculus dajiuhuensis]|uniref:hypothetical protein n=1 Tax=Candidatus Magnetominusculus dajiuhuensis TaxID=3137712 RepID=UPI003B43BB41
MVKLEEITSFVSSFIDKYFGPETIWPGITEEVRKAGLKVVDIAQSVYDTSVKAISGQCEKSNTGVQSTDEQRCHCHTAKETTQPEISQKVDDATPMVDIPKAETLKVEEPARKTTDAPTPGNADTVKPPARKPRAKRDPGTDATRTKSTEPKAARTRKPKT